MEEEYLILNIKNNHQYSNSDLYQCEEAVLNEFYAIIDNKFVSSGDKDDIFS